MTKEEYEKFKKYDDLLKDCIEEDPIWDDMYQRLSPQQKGAMRRKWKREADDDYYYEMRSGTL